ncbi:glycoside hydrolase family 25 protein [Altererythrobacter lutimaris]|uniref:Glycoside hydrolase family 25 protein n=1 Tax=Altererythrobacter lutimaris TaxID=2743979 RepID=A0A850HE58_9SPHN|nr:glycoside hydrolase family 25 protein [Altererythrobacter lutimaris]NVE95755.1 glycoside hydrolase family 25 protein [Altererythrobacter lutimaris]
MARRKGKARPWRRYLLAVIALGLAGLAAWYWWTMRSWTPIEDEYPEQGTALAMGQTEVSFATLQALGSQFVYFNIGPYGAPRDGGLIEAMAEAREAGLQTGAVLSFDPCAKADPQSARFVTMVPRDETLLPAAIALDMDAQNCPDAVSDAAVESELMTLINQIEMHSGKPVILRISREFEERYRVSGSIARDLWVVGDRLAPRYAARPWLIWSANRARHIETSPEPVEWLVVQP